MKLHDELIQVENEEIVQEHMLEQSTQLPVKIELTNEQIAAWKAEHGKVFKTIIDDETYIWRRLRRREYVDAMSYRSEENPDANVYLRQNIIASIVTLYPSDMSERIEEYAGLAGEISDRAILKSGFDASETEEL
ncbi:hypothetical protein MKY88_24500 [Lysinibacillus sp. FSL R7-0073]|uniref:hypothetical protein n=1 Tax=Lysinibacillus sp. FSL R7-0073 TaxID=2921669 RepID=UPI0030F78D0F